MIDSEYRILVEQYTPMIHHMLKKLAIYKNKEEFMQIGLISIWEAHENYKEEKGRFSSYLYMHMKGRLLDELKRRSKEEQRTVYPEEAFWETAASAFTFTDDEPYIQALCKSLTKREAKWVIYTFIQQLTISEIAAKENVSKSAVKGWKKGAIIKLKRLLLAASKNGTA
ncbi:sigma-70 family RNA polymerase sigma factor [Niallia taxi]|uniref:sigma-70 family RNA polymerase sigma factor n=1 Tax=Niallia taxi TaxID=2499688 RepID=UPI002E1F066B|nr:sigma-70 family RNA polymerase sigma factor [Niallia taxi]